MLASLEGDLVRDRFGTFGLPAIFSRSWLTRAFAELGQFAQGIAYGEEGVRQAEAFDNPYSLFVAYWGAAIFTSARESSPRRSRCLSEPLGSAGIGSSRLHTRPLPHCSLMPMRCRGEFPRLYPCSSGLWSRRAPGW